MPLSDWKHVDLIFWGESHWNPGAVNPGGCRGVGQACPGKKLKCTGKDLVCQIKHFDAYAKGRYGSWAKSAAHWKIYKSW